MLDANVRAVLEKRLLDNREIDPIAGCWLWTRSLGTRGYGQTSIYSRKGPYRVHRVAAALWLGFDIDSDLLVLHHCDVKRCFNPDHLFIGTAADNTADMMSKGRHRYVKPRERVKSNIIASAIRMIEKTGCSQRAAARAHGISHTTMQWYVKNR